MEDFFTNLLVGIGIIVAIVIFAPVIFSFFFINWVGNFTDSAVVYALLHLAIGLPLLFLVLRFGAEMGFWFSLIVLASAFWFIVLGIGFIVEIRNGEFDYGIYKNLSNWNPPIERVIE